MQELDRLTPKELSQYIAKNPSCLANMSESQLVEILQKVNPYSQVVDKNHKPVLFSVTNMKADYISKFETVALVKFFERMLFEYDDIAKKLEFEESKINEYKEATNKFFNYVFKFDPKYHVRSSYQDKISQDETRENLSAKQLEDIPSLDLYERLSRYKEQHNAMLKKEVNDIYAMRPGYEYAIQIYDTFDTEKAADEFKDKNGPSLSVDLYKGVTNKWILIESTEENADNVKFYSKDNEILENMIHQMKKDQEIGHKLLEKRKNEAVKSQNVTQNEKDNLEFYQKNIGTDRHIKQQLSDIDQPFVGGQDMRFYKSDGTQFTFTDQQ